MSHVRVSQSLNLRFGVFTVLLFHTVLLALIHPCRGQHQVIIPSKLIMAPVGEDIILPSLLDPPVNAFDMTVEWTRPDLDPRFVLVLRDGVELENIKHSSYVGRTSVFIEELKHGNISLKLSKVKISDGGTYRCFIPDFNIDSTVQLVVGAASSPVVQMTKNSSTVVLQCESKGWYPEPEVSWLDSEGHVLSAGPTETVRGPDGLYTVSSRVTVEKRHRNNFSCRVQQKNINQTRETQIHVPDHFIAVASTPSSLGATSAPGPPGGLPAIFVCAAFFLTVVFLVWKIWRQKRLRNKRRDLEDGAEQTDKEKTIASKSDDSRFQVMKEEEGESVPLMEIREENNLDNTGQEGIQSYSEHQDPKSVAEEETNQDQPVIKPELNRDKDGAEGEVEIKSINNETTALISTEEETHQRQDMPGGQVKSYLDKGEGEQMMKLAKEHSGLPVVVVAGKQKEKPQILQTDQNAQKETQQEQDTKDRSPKNYVDKKKAKSKEKTVKKAKEQEGATTEDWKLAGKKKQQRQMEEERLRLENKGTPEPELQRRKEKEAIELKSQSQDGDQEGNQRNFTRKTERKAKNQKEQVDEKLRGKEHKLPLLSKVADRPDHKIHQETAGRKTQELQEETQQGKHFQKYQEEAKEQPVQSTKEINAECQERREEKTDKGAGVDETQKTSKEMEKQGQLQAVQQTDVKEISREQPENFKVPAEKGTECLEVPQEKNASAPRISESSKRNQRAVTPVHQEGQENGTDKEAGDDETQKTTKEMEKQGQLQAVQQPYVKQESKEQPKNTFKVPAEKGTECLEEPQERLVKTDTRPDVDETQINVNTGEKQKCKQDKESRVDQQQKIRKRRRREEDSKQRQETLEKRKYELNEDLIMHEPQELDENSQLDVEPVCPEDQYMSLSLNPRKEGKSYLQDPSSADVEMSED